MEVNPEEAIKNNTMGTYFVAHSQPLRYQHICLGVHGQSSQSDQHYGSCIQAIAEMIIQHLDRASKTKFVAVRFGNVLGSRGSVVPLFGEADCCRRAGHRH